MKKIKFFAGFVMYLLCASCSDDAAIGNLTGISASPPLYDSCKVVSAQQIDFYFSTDVNVVSAHFQPNLPLQTSAGGNIVSVTMTEAPSAGEKFIADILVEDPSGNTLSVLVPFRTRNERVPDFVINEIRFAYSKPKSEFIELKTKTAGNLGAVRLFIAGVSTTTPVYEFPPVEVAANEYIILHLRTLPTDNGIDELGDKLNLAVSSAAAETPTTARDLWIPASSKLIHDTDVIYLMDQDDRIIDGVLLCKDEASWKKNKAFEKAAELLAAQGKWFNKDGAAVKTPQAEDAAKTTGNTATKTFCRNENKPNTMSSADWYICKTSGASPGKANSSAEP